jgi:hypothetical protein
VGRKDTNKGGEGFQKYLVIIRYTNKGRADRNQYEKGLKVADEELKKINLTNKEFRGDWNYKISPSLY